MARCATDPRGTRPGPGSRAPRPRTAGCARRPWCRWRSPVVGAAVGTAAAPAAAAMEEISRPSATSSAVTPPVAWVVSYHVDDAPGIGGRRRDGVQRRRPPWRRRTRVTPPRPTTRAGTRRGWRPARSASRRARRPAATSSAVMAVGAAGSTGTVKHGRLVPPALTTGGPEQHLPDRRPQRAGFGIALYRAAKPGPVRHGLRDTTALARGLHHQREERRCLPRSAPARRRPRAAATTRPCTTCLRRRWW